MLIKAGETRKVQEQLRGLIETVLPLMTYANKELRLGLDGSLLQLRDRLERVKS